MSIQIFVLLLLLQQMMLVFAGDAAAISDCLQVSETSAGLPIGSLVSNYE